MPRQLQQPICKKRVVPKSGIALEGKPSAALGRFSFAELGRSGARFSRVARAERELDAAEAQFGSTLDDRLAIDAASVDERPVRGREVDQVPDGAAPEQCGVGAGDAVVGKTDVVFGAAPDVNDG